MPDEVGASAGTFSVRNAKLERTIYVRMTGKFDHKLMRRMTEAYRAATDEYRGGPHLVLADMRGMAPMLPEVGQMFGSAIGYARTRGVICCAHLSDDTVQRLQAARMARQNAPGDDVTIDVISWEEAVRVLSEARLKL